MFKLLNAKKLELLFVIIIIQSLAISFMLHFFKWIEIFFIKKHNDRIQQSAVFIFELWIKPPCKLLIIYFVQVNIRIWISYGNWIILLVRVFFLSILCRQYLHRLATCCYAYGQVSVQSLRNFSIKSASSPARTLPPFPVRNSLREFRVHETGKNDFITVQSLRLR